MVCPVVVPTSSTACRIGVIKPIMQVTRLGVLPPCFILRDPPDSSRYCHVEWNGPLGPEQCFTSHGASFCQAECDSVKEFVFVPCTVLLPRFDDYSVG